MTQPLGYYTNYTPGDEGILDEIQETYGAQLQRLNRTEKLLLITQLSLDLCLASIDTSSKPELLTWAVRLQQELPTHDREGLIQCLINGVRFQK